MKTEQKSPRVVHVVPHYPGRDGVTTYATEIARAMAAQRPDEVEVLSLRATRRDAHEGVAMRHEATAGLRPWALPKAVLGELDRLVRDKVRTLHILHGAYNPRCGGMAMALRRRCLPYVYFPHDPYVPALTHHGWLKKKAFWYVFEKPALAGAAAVQLLSPLHEAPLRKHGVETPVFVVPNGCDPRAIAEVPDDIHRPGSRDELVFQYLGRMDANHKGLDLLIEGFALFLKTTAETRSILRLTGNDWHDRPKLEALARRLGIADRVDFTGPREGSSVALQAEADVCVLASRFDGFGLTLVEAMVAGRPVIVSEEAGVASFVKQADAGFVTRPRPEDICAALSAAADAKERLAEMGDRAREFVLSELTWEQAARASWAAYDETLQTFYRQQ